MKFCSAVGTSKSFCEMNSLRACFKSQSFDLSTTGREEEAVDDGNDVESYAGSPPLSAAPLPLPLGLWPLGSHPFGLEPDRFQLFHWLQSLCPLQYYCLTWELFGPLLPNLVADAWPCGSFTPMPRWGGRHYGSEKAWPKRSLGQSIPSNAAIFWALELVQVINFAAWCNFFWLLF